jgi:hypothetical protein
MQEFKKLLENPVSLLDVSGAPQPAHELTHPKVDPFGAAFGKAASHGA